jgi:hypothetical protein
MWCGRRIIVGALLAAPFFRIPPYEGGSLLRGYFTDLKPVDYSTVYIGIFLHRFGCNWLRDRHLYTAFQIFHILRKRCIELTEPRFHSGVAYPQKTLDIFHVALGLKENQGEQAVIIAQMAEIASGEMAVDCHRALRACVASYFE